MPDPGSPEPLPAPESEESFPQALAEFEQSRRRSREEAGQSRAGTVIAVTADAVVLDIGFKTEGLLPLTALQGQTVNPGEKLAVSIKGRDPEGYYELALGRIVRPTDWNSLEKAFQEKTTIVGKVTGVVKGGLSVDVGVRAFMPASRSGARDASEMAKLVEQEIRCRITKLDATEEDVVVDRRIVSEEEERSTKQRRYSEIKEGDTVRGSVRSLTGYGAFVDVGGVDALLHVSDISRSRVNKPSDVLSAGQEVEVKVLKVDPDKQRISVGMKQLEPDPWDSVAARYAVGERSRGTVTRVLDFGAFVELEPGIEGLIHVSEMSWTRKVKNPGEVVKPGDTVEAVILGVNAAERRIALGLKQALGDPWAEASQKFPAGSVVEGPVTSLTNFGAFVQVSEGIEGMIHVSDMSAEKRVNHPRDMLKAGQTVKAQVLELDTAKRRLKLGMKQMVPSSIEEYMAEHREGDRVTGRVLEVSGGTARVELGEGIQAACRLDNSAAADKPGSADKGSAGTDLTSLTSMLQARWKGAAKPAGGPADAVLSGQVRSFVIARLDPSARQITLELPKG